MKASALIALIVITCPSFSQEETDPIKQNIIEQRIEVIAEQFEDEEIDFTTLFDELSYYFDNPLNVNEATQEELKSQFLLTDRQILDLLLHRKYYGRVYTLYELMYLPGFDKATIDFVSPFITVGKSSDRQVPLKIRLKRGRSQLLVRYQRLLEKQDGYLPIEDSLLAQNPNKRYVGSPDKLYCPVPVPVQK